MAMRSVIIGALLVSVVGGTASADDIMTVELVSVAGSGCNKDDFAVAIADDLTAFTVSYNNYTAVAGGGRSILDARKNCVLDVRVRVPGGFTYGIAAADMRGFAHLEANANATAKLSFWFQGSPATAYITHDIRRSTASHPGTLVTGVIDDDWQTTDTTPVASVVWASCSAQRNLNINTQLRVVAPTTGPESYVTEDTTDGSIMTLFHIALMPCP
jgi:hypothetical protein